MFTKRCRSCLAPAAMGGQRGSLFVRTVVVFSWLVSGVMVNLAGGRAWAQDAPTRTVSFVVPFSAGAAPDALVRAIAREVGRSANVSIIVENKPGAASVLAAQAVARAAPDGHTVLITGNVAMTGNPHVSRRLAYDPVADFTPVASLARGSMVLYVNPRRLSVASVAELLQAMRKEPGRVSYGYTSITSRLPAEVLQQVAGVRLTGVPYRSGASALPDLLSGQIDMMFTDVSAGPHVAAGKLKALAVTDMQRSPFAPGVPTFEEAGVRDMDVGFWLAAYLPAKAAPKVVTRLHGLLAEAMRTPSVKDALQKFGASEFVLAPAELARFQANETAAWGRIIRAAGIEPE